ncbi:hypothetical protein CJ030_MR7G022011 [Morella rubra]|uniref:Uncharacterized protein n=1 Tax=Morella rubra TaxID=262757 RepID=A0A6A1UXX0_9ROSI|nr:hypothetical protein CJ030_MR7G022011 [Morella rubra]
MNCQNSGIRYRDSGTGILTIPKPEPDAYIDIRLISVPEPECEIPAPMTKKALRNLKQKKGSVPYAHLNPDGGVLPQSTRTSRAMGIMILTFRSLALIVVQRHTAASKSASPCSTGQHVSLALLPIPMCTRPLSKSTHAPSFRVPMVHVPWAGGVGDGTRGGRGGGHGVSVGGGSGTTGGCGTIGVGGGNVGGFGTTGVDGGLGHDTMGGVLVVVWARLVLVLVLERLVLVVGIQREV